MPRKPTHAPIRPAHIPARESNQTPPGPYITNTSNSPQVSLTGPNIKDDQDPLFNMIINSYRVLNSTRLDLTSSCWLCYDIKPPYYEGIAVPGSYSPTQNHAACRWQQKKKRQINPPTSNQVGPLHRKCPPNLPTPLQIYKFYSDKQVPGASPGQLVGLLHRLSPLCSRAGVK